MIRKALLALIFALAVVGCASTSGTTLPPPVRPPTSTAPATTPPPTMPGQPPLHIVHDPGHVTGTLTGPCHTRDNGMLPDPACTPGAYDPNVTTAQICAPGFTTRGYRPPVTETNPFKFNVAEPAYGQMHISGELDHLVPLELGGANDASNLWVEAGKIPNPKDAVENRLRDEVCAGKLALQAARVDIATDWLTAP